MTRIQSSGVWPDPEHRSLMRAALLDGKPAIAAFLEWRDRIVFDDLDTASFRVLPLLRWNLRHLGVSDPLMPRLDSVARFLFVETTMKLDALRKLVATLAREEIPRLLLKGASIGQRYYPDPALRPMADCDVLVPWKRRDEALRVLEAAGWQVHESDAAPAVHSRTLWFPPFHQIMIDFHWLTSMETTLRDDRAAWDASEEITFREVSCRALCAEDEIIHACQHGLNWNPVPPFRWLLDCAMIVRRNPEGIDWRRLAERARRAEATLIVRRSLEWIRREAGAAVPAGALEMLRERRTTRRERRTYVLKTKAKHWWDYALLFGEYLDRQVPRVLWPLRPRRVLEHFAAEFNLADRSDIIRYFVCHFGQMARQKGHARLAETLSSFAQVLGCQSIGWTLLRPDATGVVDEPSGLCWARRKLRLQGYVFMRDGSPQPPMRVMCRGRSLARVTTEVLRPDLAALWPTQRNALKSGFWALFDIPSGKSVLLIEYHEVDRWLPLFSVRIGDDKSFAALPALPFIPFKLGFADPACDVFLQSGWSVPEGQRRWSIGQESKVSFALNNVTPIEMRIKLSPFVVAHKLPEQRLEISLNGYSLDTLVLREDSPDTCIVQMPRAVVSDLNTLAFKYPRAASPADFGLSDDSRQLAIFVEWIEFHESANT